MKKIILSLVILFSIICFLAYFNANKMPTEWSEYVVRSGDTICDIAIDITPNSKDYRQIEYYIIKKNNIGKNEMIYPGQTILVPVYE